jgi:hypothetical protein
MGSGDKLGFKKRTVSQIQRTLHYFVFREDDEHDRISFECLAESARFTAAESTIDIQSSSTNPKSRWMTRDDAVNESHFHLESRDA